MVIEIEYWIFFSLLFLYKVDLQIFVQHGFSHWLVREEMPSQEWELKNNTPQDSEQELLLENFKAAANCLTSLYRNSLNVEKRARNMGIQYTLESVLSWVTFALEKGERVLIVVFLGRRTSFYWETKCFVGRNCQFLLSTE